MKKRLLVMSAFITAALLSGCGNNTGVSTTASSGTSSAQLTQSPKADNAEVKATAGGVSEEEKETRFIAAYDNLLALKSASGEFSLVVAGYSSTGIKGNLTVDFENHKLSLSGINTDSGNLDVFVDGNKSMLRMDGSDWETSQTPASQLLSLKTYISDAGIDIKDYRGYIKLMECEKLSDGSLRYYLPVNLTPRSIMRKLPDMDMDTLKSLMEDNILTDILETQPEAEIIISPENQVTYLRFLFAEDVRSSEGYVGWIKVRDINQPVNITMPTSGSTPSGSSNSNTPAATNADTLPGGLYKSSNAGTTSN